MCVTGGHGEPSGLVRIEWDGRSLALGRPGELESPESNGVPEVYAEVLDGVGLRLTVSVLPRGARRQDGRGRRER